MSFIRSGSNPERLYVYHSIGGVIHFSTPKNNNDTRTVIRANIFYRFVKLMPRWDSDFKRGCLEIKELSAKDDFKIAFYHKGFLICKMWPVTWKYIYSNVMRDINSRKR